ncbi:Na+/H+ antiporter subunit E [Miltoncostaea marina]|uniref:Na+/H+ antiporter subunit E n=1 Tax=Miltoncostaea marina TaxID=2843215 RepID=UPI001C3C748F|nr:Na+/H+ antiporter subunit E [Miltoncostaea marina]
MIGVLVRAGALTAIYLLVLTSVQPGDVLVGGAIGLLIALALRPRHVPRTPRESLQLVVAAAGALTRTAREMVIGSWRVVRFCLGRPEAPGFVEVPRGDRTGHELAMWGLLTGEAPDEVVVDIDRAREVMIVHLTDASDPDGVRERHRRDHERWRRRVAR